MDVSRISGRGASGNMAPGLASRYVIGGFYMGAIALLA